LKHPDGPALVLELCSRVDVVVENLRAGTAVRLGLDARRIAEYEDRGVIQSAA
jgi:crotonobetainyl-CoA:carnitine CoA-transferase CaiB-like acyl-CoA transferase